MLILAAYDLSLSALLGHVKVAHTERITHVLSSATHPFLIAAIDVRFVSCEESNPAVWLVLRVGTEHIQSVDDSANASKGMEAFSSSFLILIQEELDCVAISMTSPVIYFTRPGLRDIATIDILKVFLAKFLPF